MTFQRKAIACAALALFSSPAAFSDTSMKDLFDSIGAYSNTTGPGAYQSQGANVYSGGSFYYRVPQKNIQPLSLTLPSVKFGCGGIDAQVGSFSHISGPELVQTLKNIGGSAVAAFGFKLAMKAITPLIEGTLGDLQGVAQAINATTINSCEAASALSEGPFDGWKKTQGYYAQVTGPISGLFSDQAESNAKTKGDDSATASTINAITNPVVKSQIQPGNVVWRALANVATLDYDQKRILMSLTGTVIYEKASGAPLEQPIPKPPTNIKLQSFMFGDGAQKIPVYTCLDGTTADACKDIQVTDLAITPYKNIVEERLISIADKFKTNTPLAPLDIRFINQTQLPIYKALAVTTAKANTGFDQHWISNYSSLIAAEYAYHYITELAGQVKTALSTAKAQSLKGPVSDIELLLKNVESLQTEARGSVQLAYQNAQTTSQIVNEIKQFERNLFSGLPANLAGNLRFAASR